MRTLAMLSFAAALLAAGAANADALPDLGGRTIKAVTENAYTPLNFADPKTGKGIGWEYDAVNEIAKRLNLKVEWNLSSWDAMIEASARASSTSAWTASPSPTSARQQVDFSDPYMTSEQFMLVRADENRFTDAKSVRRQQGPAGRRPGRHDQFLRRRLQRPRRQRKTIRASSCSTPSAPRCRR